MLIIVGLGIYHAIDMEADGEGITDITSALKKVGVDTKGLVVKENGQEAVLTDDVRDNCVIQVYPKALQEKGGVSGHHDPAATATQPMSLGIRGVPVPVLIRQACTVAFMQILVERFTSQFASDAPERVDPFQAMAILTRMAGEIDGSDRVPSLVLAAPVDITTCWLTLPDATLSVEDIDTGHAQTQAPIGEGADAAEPEREPVSASA